MEYLLEVSLLVGLAVMVDAAPFIPNDFTDKITDAINYYNMESQSKSLFKLLEDKDINNLNHSKKIETIIIVIQETVCLKSQYLSHGSCPFKNGGEVRKCIVSIDKSDLSVASNVRCENMSDSVGNGPDKVESRFNVTQLSKKNRRLPPKKSACLGCIISILPGSQQH
ncbi:15 kDa protein B-like [Pelobates fuscus]|uniref:15 kDa protein B-like n=1 Tax=Pelobates fuscus TaxID=191477 RepID=UPI002FE4E1BB